MWLIKMGVITIFGKNIKNIFRKNIGKYPKIHNLKELINRAGKYQLKNINSINIELIQCTSAVRYDSELVSLPEAANAHWMSVNLGLMVLQQL
mgnify:CR=1 FL=1